jgi:hypothetical protein
MRTDELVELLAKGDVAVDVQAPMRRAAAAFALALLVSLALMAAVLGFLPELREYASRPMFWAKAGFALALAAAALVAARRLARPGVSLGRVGVALAAPVVAMWVLGAIALLRAAPGERSPLFFGQTWADCPVNIAMLSAPVFVASLWGMKGYAPTRLRLAGAAAGLLAGAAGAAVYALHCPELAAPFLGVWYVLGMLIPTAIGALVGPRVLRW